MAIVVVARYVFEMKLRRPMPQVRDVQGAYLLRPSLFIETNESRDADVKVVSVCWKRWRGTWARETLRRKFQSTGVGTRPHVISITLKGGIPIRYLTS